MRTQTVPSTKLIVETQWTNQVAAVLLVAQITKAIGNKSLDQFAEIKLIKNWTLDDSCSFC